MGRLVKALGATGMAIFALCAVAVAGASAASFQANETGTLSGHALTPQVFRVTAGEIRCTTAATSGSQEALVTETENVVVSYGGCTAFGGIPATVSSAEYALHASGLVDVLNTVTISVPSFACTVTVSPQAGRAAVGYGNSGGRLIVTSGIGGIVYSSSGGICGPGGINGSFNGADEIELNGGVGFIAFAAGGTLSKKAFFGGKEVKVCEFKKVGEKCKVTFEFTNEGEAKVEKAELRGAEAAVRYKNVKAGCTVGTVLKNAESCSDEIELIKVAEKTENEWCVVWDIGPLAGVPFCTKLKQ
jgi:hypothetical protein